MSNAESAARRRSLVIFKSGFYTVAGTETRLEQFGETIESEMGMELRSNSFFKYFGDEMQVRNGAEVTEIV